MPKNYTTSGGWMVLDMRIEMPTVHMTDWAPGRVARFFAGIAQAQRAIHGRGEAGGVAMAPFAEVMELPDDMADAFESFKLAILRHRLSGWAAVRAPDVHTALFLLAQIVEDPDFEGGK